MIMADDGRMPPLCPRVPPPLPTSSSTPGAPFCPPEGVARGRMYGSELMEPGPLRRYKASELRFKPLP